MKKISIFLIICLMLVPGLYAQENDSANEFVEIEFVSDEDLLESQKAPFRIKDRIFEIGLSADFFVANSYMSVGDIFKKTMVLDIDDLRDGFQIGVGAGITPLFFNFDSRKGWGFGMSLNVDATGTLGLSGKILSFKEASNEKIDLGGAAYLSTEFKSFFQVLDFKVKVKPALYYTMAYVKPSVSYTFKNLDNGTTQFFINYDLFVHTAFPMEDSSNTFNLTGSPGFDISLGVEYPLSKVLGLSGISSILDFDVGLDFVSIPVISSGTKDYMRLTGSIGSEEPFVVIDDTTESDDSFSFSDIFDHEKGDKVYGKKNISIRRPFKMLASANWRPLHGSKLLTVTPVLGFAVSPIFIEPVSFEGGISATLNIFNLFIVNGGVNYTDRIWINNLDFGFNLRALRLDFGVDMRSQEFLKSWTGAGMGVRVGLRFGW